MTKDAGPVFAHIHSVLEDYAFYDDFRNGRLDALGFAERIGEHNAVLIERGLRPNDLQFIPRLSPRPSSTVAEVLRDLHENGNLEHCDYDRFGAMAVSTLFERDFAHDHRRTFIYPEEGELLYALCELAAPRRVAYLGSYYGYWAAWAVCAPGAVNTKSTLLDIDPAACDLAKRNLERLGASSRTEVICADAIAWLHDSNETFDMIVLDAETSADHPDPRLRGKGIYEPLLEAALPRLLPGAWLVCHNILLTAGPGQEPLAPTIARTARELGPFMELVSRYFPDFREYATTEGVGIGRFAKS